MSGTQELEAVINSMLVLYDPCEEVVPPIRRVASGSCFLQISRLGVAGPEVQRVQCSTVGHVVNKLHQSLPYWVK